MEKIKYRPLYSLTGMMSEVLKDGIKLSDTNIDIISRLTKAEYSLSNIFLNNLNKEEYNEGWYYKDDFGELIDIPLGGKLFNTLEEVICAFMKSKERNGFISLVSFKQYHVIVEIMGDVITSKELKGMWLLF